MKPILSRSANHTINSTLAAPSARALRAMAAMISEGTLLVTDPDGTHRLGSGAPVITITINDLAVYTMTAREGSVGLGRAYAEGMW